MTTNEQPSRLQVHITYGIAIVLLWMTVGGFFMIWSAYGVFLQKTTETGKLDYLKGIKCGVAELFDYPRRVTARCVDHYHRELEKCGKESDNS